jgi:hypothetical protein
MFCVQEGHQHGASNTAQGVFKRFLIHLRCCAWWCQNGGDTHHSSWSHGPAIPMNSVLPGRWDRSRAGALRCWRPHPACQVGSGAIAICRSAPTRAVICPRRMAPCLGGAGAPYRGQSLPPRAPFSLRSVADLRPYTPHEWPDPAAGPRRASAFSGSQVAANLQVDAPAIVPLYCLAFTPFAGGLAGSQACAGRPGNRYLLGDSLWRAEWRLSQ